MDFNYIVKREMQLEQVLPLIEEKLRSGDNVRFSPRGVSMLPLLRQGKDAVVLSPAPKKLKRFDIPLYVRRDGKFTLHRIVKVGNTYTCIGDNQYRYEFGISHDQVIGVVSAIYRGNKRIEVDSIIMRFYAYVWCYSRPIRYRLIRFKARICTLFKH